MQEKKGTFYKAVTPELKAFYNGYQYEIGKGDKMKLKKEQEVECGKGWHFLSFWDAVAFLSDREGKIISAEIELKDIVAVHRKIRVKAFKNVQIVDIL